MYSNIDLDSVYSLNQLCYLKLSLFVCRGWILETVLGEVEKDSFITGSGKRIHPRILAWKTMYTNNGRNLLKVFLTKLGYEQGLHPGEGNGNPLQYSYLENPMDWGAW